MSMVWWLIVTHYDRNMHMSDLAQKLFAASRADVGVEQLIAVVDASLGEPSVATANEITDIVSDTPEFEKVHANVDRITQLVAAAAQASDAERVVEQAVAVRDGVSDLREDINMVNDQAGGVSLESFPHVMVAMERYCARTGREFALPTVGLESANANGRIFVDTTGLESIENQLDAATPLFIRESQTKFTAMCDAIRAALPDARERLTTLLTDLQMDNAPLSGSINAPAPLVAALSVDGQLPQDLVTVMANYVALGKTLGGEYSRRSSAAAEQLVGLLGSLNYTKPEAFWDTLKAVMEKVGDPREALGKDQLALTLPGGGKLFSAAEPSSSDGNPTVVAITRYVNDFAPATSSDTDGEQVAETATTVPCYTREQLRVLVKSVLDLLTDDVVESTLKTVERNWQSTSSAVAEVTQTVRSITGEVQMALGSQLEFVPRWVRTVHRLSVWPQVNFLTNLVFTSNALAVLGSEMLVGERAAVVEATPADPSVPAAPADEPPAVAEQTSEPVVAEPAPAAADVTDPGTEPVVEAPTTTEESVDTTVATAPVLSPEAAEQTIAADVVEHANADAAPEPAGEDPTDPHPAAGDEPEAALDEPAADDAAADVNPDDHASLDQALGEVEDETAADNQKTDPTEVPPLTPDPVPDPTDPLNQVDPDAQDPTVAVDDTDPHPNAGDEPPLDEGLDADSTPAPADTTDAAAHPDEEHLDAVDAAIDAGEVGGDLDAIPPDGTSPDEDADGKPKSTSDQPPAA